MVLPVVNVLSVVHPLLLASHEWLWGWVGWALWSSQTIEVGCCFSFDIRLKLESRPVWDSSVSDGHLMVLPVVDILSIVHPLLLTSDEWLWGWIGWALWSSQTVEVGCWIVSLDIRLKLESRPVWDSSVGNFHLMSTPVINILAIVHPLLLTSHKWLW